MEPQGYWGTQGLVPTREAPGARELVLTSEGTGGPEGQSPPVRVLRGLRASLHPQGYRGARGPVPTQASHPGPAPCPSFRAHSFIHSLTRGVPPSQPLGTEQARGPQGPQSHEPQLVTEARLGHNVTKSYRNYTAVSCQEEAERRVGLCFARDGRTEG